MSTSGPRAQADDRCVRGWTDSRVQPKRSNSPPELLQQRAHRVPRVGVLRVSAREVFQRAPRALEVPRGLERQRPRVKQLDVVRMVAEALVHDGELPRCRGRGSAAAGLDDARARLAAVRQGPPTQHAIPTRVSHVFATAGIEDESAWVFTLGVCSRT